MIFSPFPLLKALRRLGLPAILASALISSGLAQPILGAASVADPKALAAEIEGEVAEIRGLKFKNPIGVKNQSMEDFDSYLDKELVKHLPEARSKHYGQIIEKLGLYRGPRIQDFPGMAKKLMKSQAAAYYDPGTKSFYVVMSDMPEIMLGTIYSHELYHGLQDQYFDLDKYLLSQSGGELNDDEVLARQSVVEGEATFIMTLWSLQKMTGSMPSGEMLASMVRMQSDLDTDKLREMVKGSAVQEMLPESMKEAVDAMDDIPPFMIETLVGAYLKGMSFVHEIHRYGWDKVEELYEDPPASSEMILHPAKWLKHEIPYRYEWPDVKGNPLFAGWELYDTNTLGEIQWKIVFNEFDMGRPGMAASEGWDGDSYAVLGKEGSGETMLLIATSWDTENDAEDFAGAYTDLLKEKYSDAKDARVVERKGTDVYVVEGGDPAAAPRLVEFLKKLKRKK